MPSDHDGFKYFTEIYCKTNSKDCENTSMIPDFFSGEYVIYIYKDIGT